MTIELLLGLTILIFSAIFHEVAHGYVADRLGDPTARLSGRLTFNPLPHIDPMLSIFLPLLLVLSGSPVIFGAAKPVPIDPFNLKEGRKDVALVALAGPLTNVAIAIVASSLFKLFPFTFLSLVVYYNLLLAVLNLIPIPPLDGSKVFAFLLSERQAAMYLSFGSFGIVILLFLLFFSLGPLHLGRTIFHLVIFLASILGVPPAMGGA